MFYKTENKTVAKTVKYCSQYTLYTGLHVGKGLKHMSWGADENVGGCCV